ncbi:S1/P1 nuclease [Echria macrotheca]|uniref:S1/P1 nuclease n=1 Tax=Echria macrotheca TaxID=438768 RepID=A0AAJ0FBV6_9PEZI|nr:S1/P1 nuclease [Echria macrotheca]
MYLTIPTLLSLVVVVAPPVVLAWDSLGHQTVGFLAQKYFTAQANATFNALLGIGDDGEGGFDIGDAAAWADTIRDPGNLPWSKGWHFINPKADDPEHGVCSLVYPSDCPAGNCIVSAIANQTSLVLSGGEGMVKKNATMFLLHLIGDLHQPLHASGFKLGGNAVRPVCFGQGCGESVNFTSLHGVWDGGIARRIRGLEFRPGREADERERREDKEAARAWAGEIYGKRGGEMGKEGVCDVLGSDECVLRWARESNGLVCTHVLKRGERYVLEHDLAGEYYEENWRVVEDRIAKAGWRLAGWMNAVARVLGKSNGGRGDL